SDSVELSEQIKAATKDSHVRAENTELMLSYQRGRVSLQQYQLLLCSLYKIYEALEEALDTNASHEAVAPIYFPQELSRLESIGKDLEYFYGRSWREKMTVPAATLRYAQRLREVNINNQSILVIHQWKQILILIHPYLASLEITDRNQEEKSTSDQWSGKDKYLHLSEICLYVSITLASSTPI
uniref:Uncharacterized protein n=1 Tax=Cyprinus carpio TaxID=7962 RepID=A0A8C2IDI4_CYPCA